MKNKYYICSYALNDSLMDELVILSNGSKKYDFSRDVTKFKNMNNKIFVTRSNLDIQKIFSKNAYNYFMNDTEDGYTCVDTSIGQVKKFNNGQKNIAKKLNYTMMDIFSFYRWFVLKFNKKRKQKYKKNKIHLTGTPGAGKSYTGRILKKIYKDKLKVIDIDNLYNSYSKIKNKSDEKRSLQLYNKLKKYSKNHKDIIFVGLIIEYDLTHTINN